MLKEFYEPFKMQVDRVNTSLASQKGSLDEQTEYTCEKCGQKMIKKLGRFGFFLACSAFPACKNTKPLPLADCPREGCNGKIVARKKARGRGREFYGCTNYPQCDFITYYRPTELKCPECGKFLVEREDKKRGAIKLCINPHCTYLHAEEDAKADHNRAEETGESDY